MLQLGGFLGGLLESLPKTGLVLMKNVLKSLAKSVLILLQLTAADVAIEKEIQEQYRIFNAASSFDKFVIQKYQNEPRFNSVYHIFFT